MVSSIMIHYGGLTDHGLRGRTKGGGLQSMYKKNAPVLCKSLNAEALSKSCFLALCLYK